MIFEKRINELLCREKTIKLLIGLLSKFLSLACCFGSRRPKDLVVKKVLHISPIYFSEEGMLGGGERAPLELAKSMVKFCETRYVSFGTKEESFSYDGLPVRIYSYRNLLHYNKINPINFQFLNEIKWANVVHCHQYYSIITTFAVLFAKILGKKIFVTDYGGRVVNYSERVKLDKIVDKILVISKFGQKFFPEGLLKTRIIYLGIDEKKFYPLPDKPIDGKYVLYAGRILPHKGIDYLVSAMKSLDLELHIVGNAPLKEYLDYLGSTVDKEKIKFILNPDDATLLKEYNNAIVTILPSVYKDIYNHRHKAPELLGLTLLESMACETPVICTKVGGMPEIVRDVVTGFIVPPNDSKAIAEKINYLFNYKEEARKMAKKGREFVLDNFTVDKAAVKYLNAYEDKKTEAYGKKRSLVYRSRRTIISRINEIICREKTIKILLYLLSKIVSVYHCRRTSEIKRVLHISPIYFSKDGLMGGGERSPMELAKAMTKYCETRYISFGKQEQSTNYEKLQIKIYKHLGFLGGNMLNPINLQFLSQIRWADVVHCNQYYSIVTSFSILMAKLLGKKVFLTDRAGKGVDYNIEHDLAKLVDGFLMVSKFHAVFFGEYGAKSTIVSSGVNENKFYPLSGKKQDYILYVGRILPHKGVNYLVSAMDFVDAKLHIVGAPESERYFSHIKSIAMNEKVDFFPLKDTADEFLLKEYNNALVTVLPSVQHDIYGYYHPTCESFGVVLVESMACGTPVICSGIGGMLEIVQDGVTGFIVPPNDSKAIAEKINYLLAHKEEAREMGKRGRKVVLEKFNMNRVALNCLKAYKNSV